MARTLGVQAPPGAAGGIWAERNTNREKRFSAKLKRQAQQLGYKLVYRSKKNPPRKELDQKGRGREFLQSEVVDADPPVNRGRPREWGRNRQAPVRSTGVLGTACREDDLSNWGRSGVVGSHAPNVVVRMAANPEVGEGHGTVDVG